MNIYSIDIALLEHTQAILDLIDEETGEITDVDEFEALKAEIDGLQMAREQKISNVACWIKNLNAEAEAIKTEKQNLAKRQQALERKSENLKKYLEYALHGEKFEDARCKISYRRSEGIHFCEGFDGESLPDEFVKVEKKAKLTEIKNAIKEGREIPGVSLVSKNNIQIR